MSALPIENKVNTVSFYDPKSEAEAKRKKQLAEILIQQGNAPFKNEMAGGMTVARSPWENINQGAQKYMGEFKLAQADDRQAELDANRQKGMAEALSKWGENPQEAAMMLAQDPRYADMAAKILGGEVDYGRQKERWAQQDALQREQLAALNQRASMGGSTPAAMQVANRMYELQMIASDPNMSQEERMAAQTQYNLIGQAQKTFGFDKGMEKSFFDPNQATPTTPQGGFADIAGDGVYNVANEGNLPLLDDNAMVDPTQVTTTNQMPQPMPIQPIVQPVQGFGETKANFAGQEETAKSRAKYMEEGRQMLPKAQRALQSAELRGENIRRVASQIAQDAQQAFTTGFTGSIAGAVAGTPAFDLKNNLQTLEATAAFDTLQTMRDKPTAQPQIAVNPQTGERMINRGNGWEPYNGQ
jgi:hypothetical protein